MNVPDPIIITGAARSGTSMIAGVAHLCGAFKGDTGSGQHKNNAKGMFENLQIRNEIIKPLLRDMDIDPKAQYPLQPKKQVIPAHMRNEILRIMLRQGYKGGRWMIKEPKITHCWPAFVYAFPRAKWLIVRRRDEEIIKSCMNTGFMNAYCKANTLREISVDNEQEGWQYWLNIHKQRFYDMIEQGVNARMIWPERMVNGDYSEMMDVVDWMGLDWAQDSVHQFIEPRLWKARRN